tara:strand:- start:12217 stop:12456 length:240 start_codon:yes stop_codon:yes gene_type:complete
MDKEKQKTIVKVEEVDNGILVSVCYGGEEASEDKKFVYTNIEKAVKSLPAIFSVGEAEAPEEDDDSMEKMKSNLTKEDY